MDHEIKWRRLKGIHPEVLDSYVRFRKEAQREEARRRGLCPRSRNECQNKRRRSVSDILEGLVRPRDEGPNEVEVQTMKELVANLPKDLPGKE